MHRGTWPPKRCTSGVRTHHRPLPTSLSFTNLTVPSQRLFPHFFVAFTIGVVFSRIYVKDNESTLPMYTFCLFVGPPRLFNLGNSLKFSKLFLSLRPPPHWSRSPRGWITRGCPLSPGRRVRARSSNNRRHIRPKYKGAGGEFFILGRHHVPHIPVSLSCPMHGHIAQRRVSRVSPAGQESTHRV